MKIHTHTSLKLTRRLRRLRQSDAIRAMMRETRLAPEMFVLPLFVCEGEGVRREVSSMPGVFNLSVDEAVKEAEGAKADGVNSVLLFGLPDRKDDIGSLAYDPEAPVQTAIRAIKRASPETLVITDVCLCEYTDHGHCGIITDEALREVELDIAEGADIVMVKPAVAYLDVIARVKDTFHFPTAAYHVSGEYAMLKAAARNGWIDEPRAMLETLTSIRRAGADILITYYAREAARALA